MLRNQLKVSEMSYTSVGRLMLFLLVLPSRRKPQIDVQDRKPLQAERSLYNRDIQCKKHKYSTNELYLFERESHDVSFSLTV